MIEEHENQETNLQDLIDLVERDDLPTNEFSIQDKDPMVILGKLNEVIANLELLNSTINSSDNKANEALQKAIQAVADATQALSVANGIDAKATQALANAIEAVGTANTALSASNTALNTANTATSTANTALSSANSAVETAENALGTAERAESKADTAISTANEAKTTAVGIDAKATTALANSQTAVSTANTAETKAQQALDQVVTGLGTKIYRDSQLLSSLDIKPIEDDIANNTTAITVLQNEKVDKVTGKQLSTEDFTTAEKNKLAGLNNYDDTQVQADLLSNTNEINALHNDITAVENRVTTNESDIVNLTNILSTTEELATQNDTWINARTIEGTPNLEIENIEEGIYLVKNVNNLTFNGWVDPININGGGLLLINKPKTPTTLNYTKAMVFINSRQGGTNSESLIFGYARTLNNNNVWYASTLGIEGIKLAIHRQVLFTQLWSGSYGTNEGVVYTNTSINNYDFLLCTGGAWNNSSWCMLVPLPRTTTGYGDTNRYFCNQHNAGTSSSSVKGTSYYVVVEYNNVNGQVKFRTGYDNTASNNQGYLTKIYGLKFGGYGEN